MSTTAEAVYETTYEEDVAILRAILRKHGECEDAICPARSAARAALRKVQDARDEMLTLRRIGVGTDGCSVGYAPRFSRSDMTR